MSESGGQSTRCTAVLTVSHRTRTDRVVPRATHPVVPPRAISYSVRQLNGRALAVLGSVTGAVNVPRGASPAS